MRHGKQIIRGFCMDHTQPYCMTRQSLAGTKRKTKGFTGLRMRHESGNNSESEVFCGYIAALDEARA